MKRLAATALALGAVAAFATPAHAATTDLGLYSNWMPVTIKVNGTGYRVDGGPGGYDWTRVKVTVGSKVTLEAPQATGGMVFCHWHINQVPNRIRTVTIRGDGSDFYTTNYGRSGMNDC